MKKARVRRKRLGSARILRMARKTDDTAKNPHAVALGRLGGAVISARKADAVRKNGRKGGRPVGSKTRRKVA